MMVPPERFAAPPLASTRSFSIPSLSRMFQLSPLLTTNKVRRTSWGVVIEQAGAGRDSRTFLARETYKLSGLKGDRRSRFS